MKGKTFVRLFILVCCLVIIMQSHTGPVQAAGTATAVASGLATDHGVSLLVSGTVTRQLLQRDVFSGSIMLDDRVISEQQIQLDEWNKGPLQLNTGEYEGVVWTDDHFQSLVLCLYSDTGVDDASESIYVYTQDHQEESRQAVLKRFHQERVQ